MKNYISRLEVYERAKKEANYMIVNNATVRQTAKAVNVSKSTVYKDVTRVLEEFHDPLKIKCEEILLKNKDVRHLRGGEATRQKYLKARYTR